MKKTCFFGLKVVKETIVPSFFKLETWLIVQNDGKNSKTICKKISHKVSPTPDFSRSLSPKGNEKLCFEKSSEGVAAFANVYSLS